MSASPLGYEVGDRVYVFNRYGFILGTLTRVTPSGQHVVSTKADAEPLRFNKHGRQPRNGWRVGPWLERKDRAEERAEAARQENQRARGRKGLREGLEALGKLCPVEQRDELARGLEELREKVLGGSL